MKADRGVTSTAAGVDSFLARGTVSPLGLAVTTLFLGGAGMKGANRSSEGVPTHRGSSGTVEGCDIEAGTGR